MNYLGLIKTFWRSHNAHSFSITEIALYFHLVETCNICYWENPFRRNNARIMADLGISINVLKHARNTLKQSGLIDFESKSGNANVKYWLSSSKSDEVGCKAGCEVDNEVDTRSDHTKYKQSETEQNETKQIFIKEDTVVSQKIKSNNCKAISKNKKPSSKPFAKPTLEEIEEYSKSRGSIISSESFYDYYESNGWMVGKNKMKDWKATVRNWERKEQNNKINNSGSRMAKLDHPAADYKNYDYELDGRF